MTLKISLNCVFQVLRKKYPNAKIIAYNDTDGNPNCIVLRIKKGPGQGIGFYHFDKLEFSACSDNWIDLFTDVFIHAYSGSKKKTAVKNAGEILEDVEESELEELFGSKDNHEDLFSEETYEREKGLTTIQSLS
jgi:hypothetical protein